MEKEEFIQRMSTLQTESDEFIERYIKKIYDCEYARENGESILLRYTGNDIEVIKRLFVTFCNIYFPDFVIDDSNKKALNYLLHMLADNVEKPGLIIRGNIGSGKTLLTLIYLNFLQHVAHGYNYISYYNPIKITSEYMRNGFQIFEKNQSKMLIIDDIGISTESSHYGNKINVIEYFLYARYDAFKKNKGLQLICTTNLVYKDMVTLYGERAISRLNEMAEWNEGVLICDDRRKQKPLKEWPVNTYNEFHFMP